MDEKLKFFFVGIILGILFTMIILSSNIDNNSIDIVESYINLNNLPDFFKVRVNENTTLGQIRDMYNMYPQIGRTILYSELTKVCN